MFRAVWRVLQATADEYVTHDLLTRGAAIAYYTVFALAPVLIIVIAVAGLVFGEDAARGAVVQELSGMMGERSADVLQTAIRSASNRQTGAWASIVGVGALLITASGVFGEMQLSLNLIWRAKPRISTLSRLVRARLVSLSLVVALGFLAMVSLVVDAGLTALHSYLDRIFPAVDLLLRAISFGISFLLISMLFAAIYKILPDTPIAWRDVSVGAISTAFLFTVGKSLIGLYLGHSSIASSFGAAGALAVILVWIYYSAQVFLLGAAFTHAFAERRHACPYASNAIPNGDRDTTSSLEV